MGRPAGFLWSLVSVPVLFGSPALAANGDLYAAISQSAVNKVLSDAAYPVVVIDNWWPDCCDSQAAALSLAYTEAGRNKLLTWASQHDGPNDQYHDVGKSIEEAQAEYLGELRRVELLIDAATNAHQTWIGPSKQEIQKLRDEGLPFRPYLKHIKINVLPTPTISLAGNPIQVQNVKVSVDATGQLYAYVLQFKCTKYLFGICVGGDFYWGWTRITQASISGVRININGALHLAVANLTLDATPEITYMRLAYPILKDIPLEQWVNPVVSGDTFPLINAKPIMAAIPYVDINYHVKTLSLSDNGEIRLDITIEK